MAWGNAIGRQEPAYQLDVSRIFAARPELVRGLSPILIYGGVGPCSWPVGSRPERRRRERPAEQGRGAGARRQRRGWSCAGPYSQAEEIGARAWWDTPSVISTPCWSVSPSSGTGTRAARGGPAMLTPAGAHPRTAGCVHAAPWAAEPWLSAGLPRQGCQRAGVAAASLLRRAPRRRAGTRSARRRGPAAAPSPARPGCESTREWWRIEWGDRRRGTAPARELSRLALRCRRSSRRSGMTGLLLPEVGGELLAEGGQAVGLAADHRHAGASCADLHPGVAPAPG